LKMLRKLYINIHFLEAVTNVPSYTKFLKDLLSNRGKLEEHAIMKLDEEFSTFVQSKLPKKMFNPSNCFISCAVDNVVISHTLCDLRASVNLLLYSMCRKLQVEDLNPTTISI